MQEETNYRQMYPFLCNSDQSNILKWFVSPLFTFAVKSHWSRGWNAPCIFFSKLLLHGESPPGWAPRSRDDSSQMWSVKWSLLVFVYTKLPSCLMIQNPNKLATSSNKLSSFHTLQWCEESCPVRLHRQHMKAGKSFLTVCPQKCDTQSESRHGMSWVLSPPPPPRLTSLV